MNKNNNPFSMLDIENMAMDNIYLYYLFMISLNMFKYENLPNNIDDFYMEYVLQTKGYIEFLNDKTIGLCVCQCTIGGGFNHQYQPTMISLVDPTGILNKTIKFDEGVLIKNSPLYIPTYPFLKYYADLLSTTSKTIKINLENQWTPYIISSPKRLENSWHLFLNKIKSGARAIFTSKNMDLNDIQVFPTQAPFISNDLDLMKKSIIRECMTLLGIDNANQDKKERVQSAEVHANNTQILASRNIWLAERKKAIEKINEKFNLDIKVSFRAYEDLMDLIEINSVSIDEGVEE